MADGRQDSLRGFAAEAVNAPCGRGSGGGALSIGPVSKVRSETQHQSIEEEAELQLVGELKP